ncbi:MAG: hypothetical protein ACRD7E_29115, partial [Bryobacteraceae bacterium]
MRLRLVSLRLLCLAALIALLAAGVARGESLFDAIHTGEPAAVRRALKSGNDPNSRDASGATPLMHAGAYASI